MIDAKKLFEAKIVLYVKPSYFILKLNNSNLTFSINKINNQLETNHTDKYFEGGLHIYGIVGVLEAPTSNYLIVITEASYIGSILRSQIFKIEDLKFYPFTDSNEIHPIDLRYIQMYKDFLKRNNLYFSYKYDLTNSLRRYFNNIQSNSINKKLYSSIYENLNPNYCWNYHLLKPFIKNECEGVFLPLINGFIATRTIDLINKEFNFILISRKDHRRYGLRYHSRGADLNGCVSNFVETEEILTFSDDENYHILSYYMLRGSIPLCWNQDPDLSYCPKITIKDNYEMNNQIFKKHLNEITDEYTKVLFINLIDKKGDQKLLGDAFQNIAKQNKFEYNHEFVWFDFHKECKNIKNLEKLLKIQTIKENSDNFEYTHIVVPSSFSFDNYRLEIVNNVNFLSCQTGVIRINCIDSLDRTNVVQTFFAKEILKTLLKKINLCFEDDNFQNYFFNIVNNIWADNGDQLALSYSGTKAMKSYYLRKGKFSRIGLIKDGYYSVKRYFLNNFFDGYNQDCVDYALSKTPFRSVHFKKHSSSFFKSILMITFVLTFVFYYFTIIIFNQETNTTTNSTQIVRSLIFLIIFYLNSKIIFNNVKEKIIDKPSNKEDKSK